MSEPGWNDAQISRFTYRVGLFRRRGQTEQRAEALAESLVRRDAELDDRRLCLECASLQRAPAGYGNGPAPSPRCGPASAGKRKDASKRCEPVTDILQRCPHFTFQKP